MLRGAVYGFSGGRSRIRPVTDNQSQSGRNLGRYYHLIPVQYQTVDTLKGTTGKYGQEQSCSEGPTPLGRTYIQIKVREPSSVT